MKNNEGDLKNSISALLCFYINEKYLKAKSLAVELNLHAEREKEIKKKTGLNWFTGVSWFLILLVG